MDGCPTLPAVCAGGWAFRNVDSTPKRTAAAAAEQLSFLPSRRRWTGAAEQGMAEDFVSESVDVASKLQVFEVSARTQRTRRARPERSRREGGTPFPGRVGEVNVAGFPPPTQ